MSKKKKITLPKNFEEILEKGNIEEAKAVFEQCDVNARGGYAKQSAIAFDKCPDDLARWLIERGADLHATDTWGNTPLHQRARSKRSSIQILIELGADLNSKSSSIGTPLHAAANSHNPASIRLLVDHGAKVNEINNENITPLELALRSCSNIDIENTFELSSILLNAGAKRNIQMKNYVEEIGKRFEFHRSEFNPSMVDNVSSALNKLYELFEVNPVPLRQTYDGKSPIIVKANTWQKQHEELWNLLVPSSGSANTIQGELIRISGRISSEIEDNGGINWDSDYKKMADAFLKLINNGNKLTMAEIKEVKTTILEINEKKGNTARIAQLAVKWVIQNPLPIKLPPQSYKR